MLKLTLFPHNEPKSKVFSAKQQSLMGGLLRIESSGASGYSEHGDV